MVMLIENALTNDKVKDEKIEFHLEYKYINLKGCKMIKKVMHLMSNLIIIFIIIMVSVSLVSYIQTKGKQYKVPYIGKYEWLSVLTGSMEPIFKPGDLIIDKKVAANSLKVGDIVTYNWGTSLSTHRIIEITKDSKGEPVFKVKGDNNNTADESLLAGKAVVGKYIFRIPFLGFIFSKFKGPIGLIIVWLLFIYTIVMEVFSNIKKPKKNKTDDVVV